MREVRWMVENTNAAVTKYEETKRRIESLATKYRRAYKISNFLTGSYEQEWVSLA